MSDENLSTLVSNLQASVNNISQAFSNVQSSLSNMNQYDTLFNTKLNNVAIKDGVQDSKLELNDIDDLQQYNRINYLEAKFPISNLSILDETINKDKIKDLKSDLNLINNNISLTQSDIQQFKILESNNKVNLQNQINNNLALSNSNNVSQNEKWTLLLSSTQGDTHNPFQIAIDSLKASQLNDEAMLLTHSNNLNSLDTDNTANKNNINNLLSDNVINKNNIVLLQNDNTLNKNNISSLQTFTTTINNDLTSQKNKEANDILQLTNNLNTLSAL